MIHFMKNLYSMSFIFLAVTAVLSAQSCTDSGLELLPVPPPPILDDKIEVAGRLCTENPEALSFPLRVVFLVDCSESMKVNDPPDPVTGMTGREQAVLTTVQGLLSGEDDVKISVVRFSSEAQPLTAVMDDNGQFKSYFSDDVDFISQKIFALGETDRTTNYLAALSEAYSEIRHELGNAEQESLAMSTYHVILISDGIPDIEGGDAVLDMKEKILESTKEVTDLGTFFHLGKIEVSTALLSSGNLQVDAIAQNLLLSMAKKGNGTFRSFLTGGELNFFYVDLSALHRVFTLKTLVVQNINAVVDGDNILADADGDGLADIVEQNIGSNPFVPDTDGDGCNDGIEYRFSTWNLDPIDPVDTGCFVPDLCLDDDLDGNCDNGCTDADSDGFCDCLDVNDDGICDPENFPDTDGDSLSDCEEMFTGSNSNGADADGDGMMDALEFRFKTSLDIDDVKDDLDWDQVTNGEEIRTGTDPLFVSKIGRSKIAYRYNVKETSMQEGQNCYDFSVENITLTSLLDGNESQYSSGHGGQGYSSWNRILVIIGEVPFDDFDSYSRFRIACVQASFNAARNIKDPPSGKFNLTDTDFVSLKEFDPSLHCISPGD